MRKTKVVSIKPYKVPYPFIATPRAHFAALMTVGAPERRCYDMILLNTYGMRDRDTGNFLTEVQLSIEQFSVYCKIGYSTAKSALRTLAAMNLITIGGPEKHNRRYGIKIACELASEPTENARYKAVG